MLAPDVTAPLYAALLGEPSIIAQLPAYKGAFPIFTRRPVPIDAGRPQVLISADITVQETDGVADERPLITRDIAVYGFNDTAFHYNQVDDVAYAIRELFHRNPRSISVPGWSVVQIRCIGPRSAPGDDDNTVGTAISLNIQLAALR